jgi:hypothetical protein
MYDQLISFGARDSIESGATEDARDWRSSAAAAIDSEQR